MDSAPLKGHDLKEWRRMQALHLKQQGWKQRLIASALGVSNGAVSRWLTKAQREGVAALLSHPGPGPTPKLALAQQRLIPDLLWHGAEAYGFRGDVWTCARVARAVKEEFGILYSKSQISRLLRKLNWTPQIPVSRAFQRDEEAIENWRIRDWPELKKRAKKERKAPVFVDESGFYLLPGIVKTYSPRGLTPLILEGKPHDHLSVMGGMTPKGKIYVLVRRKALNGLHTIEFLKHLLRYAGPRLLLIWDGSPIHRRVEVKEFLSRPECRSVQVERLPAYAPDLNPWDEGGWNHLKHVELRNLICLDLEELHLQFHLAIGRLRQKPHIVLSFFHAAGLLL